MLAKCFSLRFFLNFSVSSDGFTLDTPNIIMSTFGDNQFKQFNIEENLFNFGTNSVKCYEPETVKFIIMLRSFG